jgi:hypothetical protein
MLITYQISLSSARRWTDAGQEKAGINVLFPDYPQVGGWWIELNYPATEAQLKDAIINAAKAAKLIFEKYIQLREQLVPLQSGQVEIT